MHLLLTLLLTLLLSIPLLATAGGISGNRRVRHINARDAGALLVYDARHLTGLADGDAVSTWPSRGTSANDLTQTSTQRPLYKVGIQGGQPVVRFDGSNDVLSSTSTIATPATFCIISVFKASNGGTTYTRGALFTDAGQIEMLGSINATIWVNGNGSYTTNASGKNLTSNWAADSTWRVSAHVCNATHASHSIYFNGVAPSLINYSSFTNNPSTGTALMMRVGARNGSGTNPLNGDFAAFIYWPIFPSSPLIQRFNDSTGYAFKIKQR